MITERQRIEALKGAKVISDKLSSVMREYTILKTGLDMGLCPKEDFYKVFNEMRRLRGVLLSSKRDVELAMLAVNSFKKVKGDSNE